MRTPKRPEGPRLHQPYLVEDAARAMGVCKGTMRRWIKEGELRVIDGRRPTMVLGRDLKALAEKRRTKGKQPCPPGWLYCLKCRTPRPPALGRVEFIGGRGRGGNLKARCGTCGTIMNRRCRADRIAAAMPNLDVSVTHAPEHIGKCHQLSLNADSKKDRQG